MPKYTETRPFTLAKRICMKILFITIPWFYNSGVLSTLLSLGEICHITMGFPGYIFYHSTCQICWYDLCFHLMEWQLASRSKFRFNSFFPQTTRQWDLHKTSLPWLRFTLQIRGLCIQVNPIPSLPLHLHLTKLTWSFNDAHYMQHDSLNLPLLHFLPGDFIPPTR